MNIVLKYINSLAIIVFAALVLFAKLAWDGLGRGHR